MRASVGQRTARPGFYARAVCALAVPVGVTALLKLRDAGRLADACPRGGLSARNHAAIPRRPGSSRLVPDLSNCVTGHTWKQERRRRLSENPLGHRCAKTAAPEAPDHE